MALRSFGLSLFEAEHLFQNLNSEMIIIAIETLGEQKRKNAIAEQLAMAEAFRMAQGVFASKKGASEYNQWRRAKENELRMSKEQKKEAKKDTVFERLKKQKKRKK